MRAPRLRPTGLHPGHVAPGREGGTISMRPQLRPAYQDGRTWGARGRRLLSRFICKCVTGGVAWRTMPSNWSWSLKHSSGLASTARGLLVSRMRGHGAVMRSCIGTGIGAQAVTIGRPVSRETGPSSDVAVRLGNDVVCSAGLSPSASARPARRYFVLDQNSPTLACCTRNTASKKTRVV